MLRCAALLCVRLRCAALCCAALRCAVLCCAVQCCAVLCFAGLGCAVLCGCVLSCAVVCCGVLCRTRCGNASHIVCPGEGVESHKLQSQWQRLGANFVQSPVTSRSAIKSYLALDSTNFSHNGIGAIKSYCGMSSVNVTWAASTVIANTGHPRIALS